MYPKTRTIFEKKGSKTVKKNSKIWIARGMNGVIGMRAPVTTNQIAIKDAERQKEKANQRERNGLNRSKVSTGWNGFAGRVSAHAKSLI